MSLLTVLKIYTHTHAHTEGQVCVSLVSVSFVPLFLFFWFSGFTPNSVQLVTCHATSSCNVGGGGGGCSRPSIDYGPLYGPRAVLSLIRFLLFPHTCLWAWAWAWARHQWEWKCKWKWECGRCIFIGIPAAATTTTTTTTKATLCSTH